MTQIHEVIRSSFTEEAKKTNLACSFDAEVGSPYFVGTFVVAEFAAGSQTFQPLAESL